MSTGTDADGAGAPWIAARVARPVRDLGRSAEFYGRLLGLPRRGGFTGHEGYDGAFFALPGGAELELTTGPGAAEDDLLVLYLPTPEQVRAHADALQAAGVRPVPAANPYWNRWGRTLLDPDGYRVVLAAQDGTDLAGLHVRLHEGPREVLRPLFELAEDSPAQLASYLDAGRVLVAVTGSGDVVGHLQLVDAGPRTSELTNMAVPEEVQGRGVGSRLVAAAVDLLAAGGAALLLVATAAARGGKLRFFQPHRVPLPSGEPGRF